MKKLTHLFSSITLFCLLAGCATVWPEHFYGIIHGSDHSGVLSVRGYKVSIYGAGYNNNAGNKFMSLSDRKKGARKDALQGAESELKNSIEKLFDLAAGKFNSMYPDKKIQGDELDSLKKAEVEKAVSEHKIMFDSYGEESGIYIVVTSYEINTEDMKIPREMKDIFTSAAQGLIKPDSEEAKVMAGQQSVTMTAEAAGTGSAETETATTQESSGTGAPGGATYDQSAEPFWVKEYRDTNNTCGIVSVKGNEIIAYGRAYGMQAGAFGQSDKNAKMFIGKCIDEIIDKTINDYLKLHPSEQPACDAVKTASKNISSDAANNGKINSRWIKETKVLLSTAKMYYSLSTYKFDINLLKMPPEMENIFIADAKSEISPDAKDILSLMSKHSETTAAPNNNETPAALIVSGICLVGAAIVLLFWFGMFGHTSGP